MHKINKEALCYQGLEKHDWEHVGEDYGGLSSGGSHDIYDCKNCGKRDYSPMPD